MKTTKSTLATKIASAFAAATIGLALAATPAMAMADEMDVPAPIAVPEPVEVPDPIEVPDPVEIPDPVVIPDPVAIPDPLWDVEDSWDVTLDADEGWVPVDSVLDTFYVVFQDDYVVGSSWATPREQLRAILVALRHARLATSASVVTDVDPYLENGVRLVDVTLAGRGVRYVYTIEAATGHIVGLSIR